MLTRAPVQPDDDQSTLATSDFSEQLRLYGNRLRNVFELRRARAISAGEELFYVLAGLNLCLANSRKISLARKAKFREELDTIEKVVTPALEGVDGRRYYRKIAKALRNGGTFDFDPSDVYDSVVMQLCTFGKNSKTTFAQITASLAHTTFEKIPSLCNICPVVALDGSEYCSNHSPSSRGKKGYSRGQRVFDSLYPNRPSRGSNPFPVATHQQWRKNLGGENESDPQLRAVWLDMLMEELQLLFGDGWELKVSDLIPTFLLNLREKRAGGALTKLIDPLDEYAGRHPRYFAKKLKEFYVFVEADRKIQRRNVVTYEKLVDIVAKNDGSTLKAAAEVGLSRRRVQAILQTGRNFSLDLKLTSES